MESWFATVDLNYISCTEMLRVKHEVKEDSAVVREVGNNLTVDEVPVVAIYLKPYGRIANAANNQT